MDQPRYGGLRPYIDVDGDLFRPAKLKFSKNGDIFRNLARRLILEGYDVTRERQTRNLNQLLIIPIFSTSLLFGTF